MKPNDLFLPTWQFLKLVTHSSYQTYKLHPLFVPDLQVTPTVRSLPNETLIHLHIIRFIWFTSTPLIKILKCIYLLFLYFQLWSYLLCLSSLVKSWHATNKRPQGEFKQQIPAPGVFHLGQLPQQGRGRVHVFTNPRKYS